MIERERNKVIEREVNVAMTVAVLYLLRLRSLRFKRLARRHIASRQCPQQRPGRVRPLNQHSAPQMSRIVHGPPAPKAHCKHKRTPQCKQRDSGAIDTHTHTPTHTRIRHSQPHTSQGPSHRLWLRYVRPALLRRRRFVPCASSSCVSSRP